MLTRVLVCTLLFVFHACAPLRAESGYEAWLRYPPQRSDSAGASFPTAIVALDQSPVISSAQGELMRGIRGMRDRIIRVESHLPQERSLVLGTVSSFNKSFPESAVATDLPADSYILKTVRQYSVIIGSNDRGILYGAFALLRKMRFGESMDKLDEQESPSTPIRWANQWDNLDGSIERGYGGRSIFWEDGHARAGLERVRDYGRLLASIGINGCAISNVNADVRLLASSMSGDIARIADALRPWGVRVVLSVDFGSPRKVGQLDTFDPLDPRVAEWWKTEADAIYSAVPDLAGFLIKADSEGRVGPSFYHRSHADAANVVARALRPHGGMLFYRTFVYDHHMDWRDPRNDRARAAYDNFKPLDGQFDSNVVLQVKNGPIDFQVREPVSPLISALERTNQAIELQVTQEYMGQARHLVFLPPQWKEVLDFDTGKTRVKDIVSGKTWHRPIGGYVGVVNAGMDENWFGNHLSQANLYGFGRLAWNPDLSARAIAEEWTRLTFGDDPRVTETITAMQLASWRTYENYTGPFGLQTLTDIVGNHFGVAVEASEGNGWGQWHRADHMGVGMDRSAATGTGFAGQYRAPVMEMYEKVSTTPDDLLLFFHHVPYTYVLHSGKSVIQSIYDTHYQGAEAAEANVREWGTLENLVDAERFRDVRTQLQYQAGQAELWRDAVCSWFLRESGIPDRMGRVGHETGRVEAEAMKLDGYTVQDVTPWEAASGGKAIVCRSSRCSATMTYSGSAGWYALRIRYFDQNTGAARFRAFAGDQMVDEWIANDRFPSAKIDGSTSNLRITPRMFLKPGDAIRAEGEPDSGDLAALDYIELAN